MYARTVRYEGVTDAEWEIGSTWFRDDYLPVLNETAGFEGAYLFRERERGITLSLTFWSDAGTAAASGKAVQQHLDKWTS